MDIVSHLRKGNLHGAFSDAVSKYGFILELVPAIQKLALSLATIIHHKDNGMYGLKTNFQTIQIFGMVSQFTWN